MNFNEKILVFNNSTYCLPVNRFLPIVTPGVGHKTVSLKNGDHEIYLIVQKYFLETLVRLHREGEGAPYTGLKPAGSASEIVVMADQAIADKDIDGLITRLNKHLSDAVREKYNEVSQKNKTKDQSVQDGRAYVKSYVEYMHFLEGLHESMIGENLHSGHVE